MKPSQAIALDRRYVVQTYRRFPAVLVKGRGAHVWDSQGKRYLDFLTGITVNTLGHAHPMLMRAMKAQLSSITHVGNLFHSGPQAALARELVRASFARRVAFANTGAEANELCIKLARKWGLKKGRHEIITFKGGFHGRTYGALTATAQAKMHKGMGPLLPGFRYAKYNDLRDAAAKVGRKTCAIMVEPIQGESGVHVGTPEFLKGLRRLCDRKGLLLVVDEVQTGLARTGKMFCYQHFGQGFVPDVMSLGKALGGGLPLSAVLVGRKAEALIGAGEHGTTMGGNIVACAAGLALLKELFSKKLAERAQKLGQECRLELESWKADFPFLREVRGRGLMIAMELGRPAAPVAAAAFSRGLIVNATAENVVRLHPPLTVSRPDLARGLKILKLSMNAGKERN